VKTLVRDFLNARDKTEFVDVIEYSYDGCHSGSPSRHISFSFCVVRVSMSKDHGGQPRLEIPIEVSGEGVITVRNDMEGAPKLPQAHRFRGHSQMIGFTIERWKKCCAIWDGITKLHDLLVGVLGYGNEQTEKELDAIGANPLLLANPKSGD
jgi:hypothetical protein